MTNSEVIQTYSKEDILNLLREENPLIQGEEKYSQSILIFETKKISFKLGLIKGEYYQDDKLEYRGSLLLPLNPSDKNTIWAKIKEGESDFYGITLDSREMKITEKIKDFISRSFEESTIPDFIPFIRGGRKE
jgi:hypothetical protein